MCVKAFLRKLRADTARFSRSPRDLTGDASLSTKSHKKRPASQKSDRTIKILGRPYRPLYLALSLAAVIIPGFYLTAKLGSSPSGKTAISPPVPTQAANSPNAALPSNPNVALEMPVLAGSSPASSGNKSTTPATSSSETPAPVQLMCPVAKPGAPTVLALNAVAPLFLKVSQGQATAQSTFAGPPGFTGVVYGLPNKTKALAWVTNDHNLVVLGTILGADGRNYSAEAMGKMLSGPPVPNQAAAAALAASNDASAHPVVFKQLNADQVRALINVTGFPADTSPASSPAAQDSAVPMVMFFDPSSAATVSFWNSAVGMLKLHQLSLELVPIANMSGSDAQEAEGILSAPDKLRAFTQSLTSSAGTSAPASPSSPDVAAELADNDATINQLGVTQLPAFIFRSGALFLLAEGLPSAGPTGLLSAGSQFVAAHGGGGTDQD